MTKEEILSTLGKIQLNYRLREDEFIALAAAIMAIQTNITLLGEVKTLEFEREKLSQLLSGK